MTENFDELAHQGLEVADSFEHFLQASRQEASHGYRPHDNYSLERTSPPKLFGWIGLAERSPHVIVHLRPRKNRWPEWPRWPLHKKAKWNAKLIECFLLKACSLARAFIERGS